METKKTAHELLNSGFIDNRMFDLISVKNSIFVDSHIYDMELLCVLITIKNITPEEFVYILSKVNTNSSKIMLYDIFHIMKIHYLLIEYGISDFFILQCAPKPGNAFVYEKHYNEYHIFSYIYNHEYDKLDYLIDNIGSQSLYNSILSIAALNNNVPLINKICKLGANNFQQAIMAAVLTNSMDAYLYLKPYLIDTCDIMDIAMFYKSHYIISDIIGNNEPIVYPKNLNTYLYYNRQSTIWRLYRGLNSRIEID